jgi:hypothetical protein
MAYHFEVTKWLSKSWTTHPPMWARPIARVGTPSCSWKLRWLPSQQKRGSEAAPVGQHDNFWRFISIVKWLKLWKWGPNLMVNHRCPSILPWPWDWQTQVYPILLVINIYII